MVERLALRPAPGPCTCGVPATTPLCVRLASSAARARPKSVILTRSTPFSSRMLAGLMSRWISPCAWAAASPLGDLQADAQHLLQRPAGRRGRAAPAASRRRCTPSPGTATGGSSTAWMSTTCSWRTGGGGPGLADEPLAGRRRGGQLRGQHLDGDHAVQLLVEGLEHDAHAALADDLEHLVVARAGPASPACSDGARKSSASPAVAPPARAVRVVVRRLAVAAPSASRSGPACRGSCRPRRGTGAAPRPAAAAPASPPQASSR